MAIFVERKEHEEILIPCAALSLSTRAKQMQNCIMHSVLLCSRHFIMNEPLRARRFLIYPFFFLSAVQPCIISWSRSKESLVSLSPSPFLLRLFHSSLNYPPAWALAFHKTSYFINVDRTNFRFSPRPIQPSRIIVQR